MKKTVYVVMKETTSPIYKNYSRPDCVFTDSKDANAYCDEKNKRAASLHYFVYKAKNGDFK